LAVRTPFGEWLRQRRHLLDLTQADLAQRTGCAAVTIRKLEAGERKPSPELARLLAAVLRIPAREQAAFIQFARSDDFEAAFRLPAWQPEQPAWRRGQLPARGPEMTAGPVGPTLHYDLVLSEAPQYEQVEEGRHLVHAWATGSVTGAIEGSMELQITQIITPKPENMGYSQALPMQIGAIFTIRSGEDRIKGAYTGSITPTMDEAGNGDARVQATGQVIFVTAGFVELFLNYVFVEDVVRMKEGNGTGASGVMQLTPPA
jgi:transcriptional regulator with XRE-family HTH domain